MNNEANDEELDTYITGILRKDSVTFPITYPASWMKELGERSFQYGFSYHFLWTSWYEEMYRFTGKVTYVSPASVQVHPEGKIQVVRAAWWRKVGFTVIDFVHTVWRKVKHAR